MSRTALLVIGAGPYWLAVAAYVRRRGVECRIVGESMEFWSAPYALGHMVRSGSSWRPATWGQMPGGPLRAAGAEAR